MWLRGVVAAVPLLLFPLGCKPDSVADSTTPPTVNSTTQPTTQPTFMSTSLPDETPTFKPIDDEVDSPFSLRDYQWQARPILVFAASENEAFSEQIARFETAIEAMADRDVILVDIVGDASGRVRVPSHLNGSSRRLSADDVRAIRRNFNVLRGDFTVLLVGKDGGEKRRERNLIDPAELFGDIDAMPMRRREMQNDRDADHASGD